MEEMQELNEIEIEQVSGGSVTTVIVGVLRAITDAVNSVTGGGSTDGGAAGGGIRA